MSRDFTTHRKFTRFCMDMHFDVETAEDAREILPAVRALVAKGSADNTELRGCVFSPETIDSLLETLEYYLSLED